MSQPQEELHHFLHTHEKTGYKKRHTIIPLVSNGTKNPTYTKYNDTIEHKIDKFKKFNPMFSISYYEICGFRR